MNAKNLDKGYFSEIIDYYDQRMFDIIKEILQFVMYSLLLFVVFFTKDFTKLHNYYNYNDFYYFKDEIYLNKYLYAGNEKCPVLKLDDIEQYDKIFNYKNCIKSTFCFEKTFIMSQLRKAFEIARLQSIQFENLFIIDVIERSERLINIIPLCADLIIIYWTFLILSITFGTNLNGFIITLGAVHKILILIKFMVIHAEYIKTSSHRFVITVFSTLFITRLMIMINTSDYLFFLLGLFIILYQVFIALFIYKFELSIFLMVLTYGILISRESTIIIVLCFTSLFYHFIHKFKKVKKATIIFFSVFLLFLLIITSDMYSDLLKSLTINIFYLDENSFGLLNFLSKNFFDFKSINIFERKDSNNYQTLLNFLSILKVDELPINTLQDISLEQLTIFSISELLQEI